VELLALQEVDRHVWRSRFADEARLVADASGLTPVFARARRFGFGGQYGIALLSRTAPTAVEVLRLPSFGAEQRLCILASVELGGRQVSVAAVHLQNRHWIAARQLPVVLDRLMARPAPHLLLGDLNAGPDVLGASITAAGLSWVPAAPTFPTRGADEHLDWIATSGLTVTGAEVPPVWQSDHFPLVAIVQ
jgi:endonuclease/exonuclease/phosphatase family metal-dependent hydrolase